MPKIVFLVPALLVVASCAGQVNEVPAAPGVGSVTVPAGGLVAQVDIAPAPAAPQAETVDMKTVEFEELDSGLVCEPRERAGSRMTRKVCYTRDEYSAMQVRQRERAQKYARDLSRDTEWREAQERMEQERRRTPGSF